MCALGRWLAAACQRAMLAWSAPGSIFSAPLANSMVAKAVMSATEVSVTPNAHCPSTTPEQLDRTVDLVGELAVVDGVLDGGVEALEQLAERFIIAFDQHGQAVVLIAGRRRAVDGTGLPEADVTAAGDQFPDVG